MEQILAGLGKRVFLMNNVHEDAPVIFQTRWAMSYLRGPLTRMQIKQLMDPVKSSAPGPAPAAETAAPAAPAARERAAAPSSARPALPPKIPQCFLPVRDAEPANAKIGVTAKKEVCLLAEFPDGPSRIDWDDAQEQELAENDLEKFPHDPDTSFGELPGEASNAKSYPAWGK
jgi:hypothetical protein